MRDGVSEDTVQSALTQMKEKKYAVELIEKGIAKENIHSYGFVFEGKSVYIGE